MVLNLVSEIVMCQAVSLHRNYPHCTQLRFITNVFARLSKSKADCVQLALELATAHHSTATTLERLLSHKGDVTEAKMRQQARLCASLDARLSAAHSTIDAAAAETRKWLQSAESVLQALALQLSGPASPGTQFYIYDKCTSSSVYLQLWLLVHSYLFRDP